MEMEKRLEPKLQKNLKIQKVFQMSDLKIDIFAHSLSNGILIHSNQD